MLTLRQKYPGFTIVELLIVIVVIAILATISIVAYNGIQDRADGAAIQSDLSNAAKKIQIAAADTGSYPVGGRPEVTAGVYTGSVALEPTPSVNFTASKASYYENQGAGSANFTYCTGIDLASGSQGYVLSAQAKSLKIYQYSSMRGAEILSATSLSASSVICSGIGYPRSYSYGYFKNNGGWQSWVN